MRATTTRLALASTAGLAIAFAPSAAALAGGAGHGHGKGTRYVLCQVTGNGGNVVVSSKNDADNKNRTLLAEVPGGISVKDARAQYGASCDALVPPCPEDEETPGGGGTPGGEETPGGGEETPGGGEETPVGMTRARPAGRTTAATKTP